MNNHFMSNVLEVCDIFRWEVECGNHKARLYPFPVGDWRDPNDWAEKTLNGGVLTKWRLVIFEKEHQWMVTIIREEEVIFEPALFRRPQMDLLLYFQALQQVGQEVLLNREELLVLTPKDLLVGFSSPLLLKTAVLPEDFERALRVKGRLGKYL